MTPKPERHVSEKPNSHLQEQAAASFLTAGSPWIDYLTGKKTSAERFVAKMESNRIKNGITHPTDAIKQAFADALAEKSSRVARLAALLQACVSSSEVLRRIILELAETGIKRLDIVSFPDPLDGSSFGQVVHSWLDSISKRPLKTAELSKLFLLLHFGWHRKLLNDEMVLDLVASAICRPEKASSKQRPAVEPQTSPVQAFLCSNPTVPVLKALLTYHSAVGEVTAERVGQIDLQAEEIAQLNNDRDNLKRVIEELNAQLASLRDQKAVDDIEIAELTERRDWCQYELSEMRGRLSGMLHNQLKSWLGSALDASHFSPPRVTAMQERIEESLKLIEKEVKWLQPSD